MIFGVLCLIGVVVGIFVAIDEAKRYNGGEPFGALATCAFVGIVFGLLVSWIVSSAINDHKIVETKTDFNVVSLSDGQSVGSSSIDGFFILGSGSFEGNSGEREFSYDWYQKTSDGITHVTATEDGNSDIKIFEIDKNAQPHVEHSTFRNDKYTDDWIAPFNVNSAEEGLPSEEWRLYIPEGSIVRDFELDNK